MRSRFRPLSGAMVVAALLVLASGCEITESDRIPVGSIFVSAQDELGVEIIGASILLDGVARPETTPGTLKNVTTGSHTVRVVALGFDPLELEAIVSEDEVTSLLFDLCHCTEGWLAVTTDVGEAQIIIDETVRDTTVTANEPIYIVVDTGPRQVSAYRQGYKTLYPQLINLIAMPDDTVAVTLSLEAGQEGNQVGDLAFDFTLENDFGEMISLHNHRGHIVLVNYWFSECQPCMEEFPEIEQIYQDYSPEGLRILALNPMATDDLADVQQVRAGLGLSFQLLLDYGGSTYQAYGVSIWPTNFIIGPGGEIVERLGSTTYEELAGIIEGLMGQ